MLTFVARPGDRKKKKTTSRITAKFKDLPSLKGHVWLH